MTQKYVGVKIVEAWPQDHEDGRPGYAVKYSDGYTSWSPKDVFENAYFPIVNNDDVSKVSREMVDLFSENQIGSEYHKETLWQYLGFVVSWGRYGLKGKSNDD